MGITIIVGGQYGGEGKGKVAHYFAKEKNIDLAVRVGGTNSGHTVVSDDGKKIILRQLPTPAILPNTIAILSAGSYIDIDLLFEEMDLIGLSADRLMIDNNAMIITEEDKAMEARSTLRAEIGSTQSGTGCSVVRRIQRNKTTFLARDIDALKPFVCDTKEYLYEQLQAKRDILIEGTQGFGLSLLHSPHYPYTTSRDTTAAGFLSEVGLSPFDVDEIVLVLRTFPIRVEGNSGQLENEITWSELQQIPELSSVTKKTRRIAKFDPKIVKKAIIANRPTKIVLNHLDYVQESMRNQFLQEIEQQIGQAIDFIGEDDKCLQLIK